MTAFVLALCLVSPRPVLVADLTAQRRQRQAVERCLFKCTDPER